MGGDIQGWTVRREETLIPSLVWQGVRSRPHDREERVEPRGLADTYLTRTVTRALALAVIQVWYDDLPTGDVAITVSAVSVFQKAFLQPYALVVQVRHTPGGPRTVQ